MFGVYFLILNDMAPYKADVGFYRKAFDKV